jgi:hypothetical protein
VLTVDHVMPTALGGSDDPTNLVAACKDCNSGKSATAPGSPLVADVAADALRWASAMKRAAEIQLGQEAQIQFEVDAVGDWWGSWTTSDGSVPPRPGDWEGSIRSLITAGLNFVDDFEPAVKVAMQQKNVQFDNRWRYFCGICWRRVQERQQMARELLAAQEGDQN